MEKTAHLFFQLVSPAAVAGEQDRALSLSLSSRSRDAGDRHQPFNSAKASYSVPGGLTLSYPIGVLPTLAHTLATKSRCHGRLRPDL